MILSLILAVDEEGGIGKNNQLPWHIRSDLKRFKALTMGHHVVMGRKTYQSIGKPLPGRVMIILSRRKGYHSEGCSVVNSLESAIELAREKHETELFIIGGGETFSQSIALVDKIYLTTVHARVNADVFSPRIITSDWKLLHFEEITPDDKDEYGSDFRILIRNPAKQG